ncbi:putative pyridoxine 5'-phosphate oxidase superfamily flavin-nucleotide-binding protein [Paucibacter oligotrophus]|uniref:Putative pyridoxine 5'-phosphate oxidase superfamily flavin-nucleotide-binding protein n=1 Tax=Roseateles oligotrophus TaxID=1769250 RepID=A0A840LHV7_9BURK|nr:pyridoxamine 5'-phosphate oxidase family protein [Roseateles oligotrophus]MBB4845599.1 putative pyridoxine 5'-phosphate oxidase superfamily flavin-nucleotide-binding protein [Roseateles oligotrophus]
MNASPSPIHAGERRMHQQLGLEEFMAQRAPLMIRREMPEQHRAFFELLPWLLIGGLDAQAQPWASLLAGPPGFAHSPSPDCLQLDAEPLVGDPLAASWQLGAPIGLLGLQAHTKRRNRLNGRLLAAEAGRLSIGVSQSFGNCPKYIHPREAFFAPAQEARNAPPIKLGPALNERARQIIRSADTFFIASASAQAGDVAAPASEGVDVSHRAGPPGFVRLSQDAQGACHLDVPDYPGNQLFNTLGNVLVQERVGLLFIEFHSGSLLWLSGLAFVEMQDQALIQQFDSAQRLLRIKLAQGLLGEQAAPLRWREPSSCP